MSEAYRLRASARKEDKVKNIFPVETIQEFVKDLRKATFYLIYDQRGLTRNHALNYFNQISILRKYFNADLSMGYPIPNEEKVVVIKIETKNPRGILDVITESDEFDFASQLCVFHYTSDEIIDKALIVGLKKYYKFIKGDSMFFSEPKQIDKIPYRGRTTVENDEEKKLVKSIILPYLCTDSVAECIIEDTGGTEIGFERLVPPGKEEHIHWHVKLEKNLFGRVKVCSKEDLKKLVEMENAFSFYSSLSKEIEWNGEKIKVRHKFVRECDPPKILRNNNMELVAEISDVTKSLCEELEIPILYMFSGSKSARVQCFIDYYDILNNIKRIDEEFPFIGVAYEKKPRTIEELYRNVYRSFNKAFDLELIEKLAEKGLLIRKLNNIEVPNVTFNSRSELKSLLILVDAPPTVSITLGSPKTMRRIEGNLVPLVCRPIEKCPTSEEEISQEFNVQTALSYFERNHKEILERFKEKITSKTLEKLFKRIGKNENKFHDLCVLKEEEFFKKYFKLGI